MSSFAVALQDARRARGLSQRALARACGLTPAYVSLLEGGRRMPERATVERLATALALTPGEQAALLLAAGYATVSGVPAPTGGLLQDAERLISAGGFTPEQQAALCLLVAQYAEGLVARLREGKPLVANLAAPWQTRILETIEEKLAEDFAAFREAYLYRVYDL